MAVNENKAEKRLRLNALDIGILLLLAVLIVTALVRYDVIDKITFSSKEFTLVLSIRNTEYGFSDLLDGCDVYTENDNLLGSVTAAELTPSVLEVTAADGSISEVSYPESTLEDITLTLRCSLGVRDGRYILASGETLTPGSELELHTQGSVFSAKVVSVSE